MGHITSWPDKAWITICAAGYLLLGGRSGLVLLHRPNADSHGVTSNAPVPGGYGDAAAQANAFQIRDISAPRAVAVRGPRHGRPGRRGPGAEGTQTPILRLTALTDGMTSRLREEGAAGQMSGGPVFFIVDGAILEPRPPSPGRPLRRPCWWVCHFPGALGGQAEHKVGTAIQGGAFGEDTVLLGGEGVGPVGWCRGDNGWGRGNDRRRPSCLSLVSGLNRDIRAKSG
jgi:hypothetical protein